MSERAYDLEAIVAAHRAAKAGGYWVRLSDMEYDAIAGTVLRGLLARLEGVEAKPDGVDREAA